jgi:hypothetical protein
MKRYRDPNAVNNTKSSYINIVSSLNFLKLSIEHVSTRQHGRNEAHYCLQSSLVYHHETRRETMLMYAASGPNPKKVFIMLEELGLPYEKVRREQTVQPSQSSDFPLHRSTSQIPRRTLTRLLSTPTADCQPSKTRTLTYFCGSRARFSNI